MRLILDSLITVTSKDSNASDKETCYFSYEYDPTYEDCQGFMTDYCGSEEQFKNIYSNDYKDFREDEVQWRVQYFKEKYNRDISPEEAEKELFETFINVNCYLEKEFSRYLERKYAYKLIEALFKKIESLQVEDLN